MKTLIRKAHIVNEGKIFQGDVLIDGEIIQQTGKDISVSSDVEVIEGKKVRSIIDEFEKENNMESRLAHGDKIARAEAWAKEQEDAEKEA